MKLEGVIHSSCRKFRNQFFAKFGQISVHIRRITRWQLLLRVYSHLFPQANIFLR